MTPVIGKLKSRKFSHGKKEEKIFDMCERISYRYGAPNRGRVSIGGVGALAPTVFWDNSFNPDIFEIFTHKFSNATFKNNLEPKILNS